MLAEYIGMFAGLWIYGGLLAITLLPLLISNQKKAKRVAILLIAGAEVIFSVGISQLIATGDLNNICWIINVISMFIFTVISAMLSLIYKSENRI